MTGDEKTIISNISLGDEQAFSLLYDAYYSYLNTIALYYLIDTNLANEIVNNVFIKLWDKREQLSYPIRGYLIKSVQNGCLNQIRASSNRTKATAKYRDKLSTLHEELLLTNPTPIEYMEMKELEKLVVEASQQLPERCRVIVELYLFEGKTPSEIARELNINDSTVRVQIKNGLDKMRLTLGHLLILFLLICNK